MFAPPLSHPFDTQKEAREVGSSDNEAIVPLYLRHTQVRIILSSFNTVNLLL